MIKDICVNLCTPLEECIDGIVCTRGVKVNVASPSIVVENMQATITCDTTGVTIKYTLDGSTPSATNGTTYSSAINLTQNCTIKAIAIKGNNVSAVAEYIYTMPIVNTPVITITDTTATITCVTNGATIYYTLDGSIPTTSSTQYTSAITLTQSCTIKAIAVKSGMTNSGIAEESYVKPITYLTQWKMLGNSEVHGNEIWTCGEYNATDGKYHILVQPLGGSIADIALTEPLRKVNSVADSIEFPATLEAFTDADGNQIATTLPNDTILHIQNLYDYTQNARTYISFNNINQRSAESKIIQTIEASYLGFGTTLQSGKCYYTSCLFKNEDAKPNIIYSNSGNSSTVSSSDYQKISLLQSNVTTLRYSALNNPTGVWQVNDVFFVKDINIFDIDAMFADCTDLKPASTSNFENLFPNLGCIDRTDTAIDVIVKDGKLYKYVETEGKALVTRYFVNYQIKDFEYSQRSDTTNCHRIRTLNTLDTINYDSNVLSNTLTVNFINKTLNDANNASEGYYVASYNQYLMFYVPKSVSQSDFETTYGEDEILVELATPTTELVDAPQIEEAESYTCEISQGGKAVSWSSFTPNPS